MKKLRIKSENDMELSRKELKELMPGYFVPPKKREKKMKHEESDLHLQFCKWIKNDLPREQPALANYPLQFVRHEREKARSNFMQNLMQVYNTDWDKLPDFEGLFPSALITPPNPYIGISYLFGLYIEFKRPGRNWLLADGKTLSKEFIGQYRCHEHLWSIGRCAYFCNDLKTAKKLLISYLNGTPESKQEYLIKEVEEKFSL